MREATQITNSLSDNVTQNKVKDVFLIISIRGFSVFDVLRNFLCRNSILSPISRLLEKKHKPAQMWAAAHPWFLPHVVFSFSSPTSKPLPSPWGLCHHLAPPVLSHPGSFSAPLPSITQATKFPRWYRVRVCFLGSQLRPCHVLWSPHQSHSPVSLSSDLSVLSPGSTKSNHVAASREENWNPQSGGLSLLVVCPLPACQPVQPVPHPHLMLPCCHSHSLGRQLTFLQPPCIVWACSSSVSHHKLEI